MVCCCLAVSFAFAFVCLLAVVCCLFIMVCLCCFASCFDLLIIWFVLCLLHCWFALVVGLLDLFVRCLRICVFTIVCCAIVFLFCLCDLFILELFAGWLVGFGFVCVCVYFACVFALLYRC